MRKIRNVHIFELTVAVVAMAGMSSSAAASGGPSGPTRGYYARTVLHSPKVPHTLRLLISGCLVEAGVCVCVCVWCAGNGAV